MPSGFAFRRLSAPEAVADDEDVFWCKPNTLALYLEVVVGEAAAALGPDHRLTATLRDTLDGLFPGYVLPFDELVEEPTDWLALLELHDRASARMLDGGELSELGRRWWWELAPRVCEQLRART